MIKLPIAYNIDMTEDEILISTKHLITNITMFFDMDNLNDISTLHLKDVVGIITNIEDDIATLKFLTIYEEYEKILNFDNFYILIYFTPNKEYVKATVTHINNLNEKLRRNLKLKKLLKSIN